ncbi:MAG: insulinase family protein [Clostridia bacterium]|nr:insulinase family protein [Clostridia bacterium]
MNPIVQHPAEGVTFLTLTDDRFTTARITVSLYLPLCEETASANAMLPFLLRRGSRRFETMTAFHRELEGLYGAAIDGSISSAGEMQIVNLMMSCLDDRFALNNEAVAEKCAELLLEVLFEPPFEDGVFTEQAVEQERRCTLESIAAEINDKRRYAVARCKKLLCEGEPYALSKYGTAERVEKLTAKELTDAWREMLETAPIRIMYQGGGDGEAVKAAFAARLADRRVKALPPVVVKEAKPTVARDNERMDVNQCQLVMGFRTSILGDDPLCDAMRLANALLGGTPHSLLFLHVREEHSLCYYCVSRYDRQKGVLVIESGVAEESLAQAEKEIMHQLDDLKNGNFTDEALENTRLSVLDALMGAQDSAGATADWYSAQGPDALRTPEDVADGIRAVTREQVIAAAATIMPDCVFTLTPQEKEDNA